MSWSTVTSSETSWNSGNGLGEAVLFDNPFLFDVDFIDFDGYFIQANGDYLEVTNQETGWHTVT